MQSKEQGIDVVVPAAFVHLTYDGDDEGDDAPDGVRVARAHRVHDGGDVGEAKSLLLNQTENAARSSLSTASRAASQGPRKAQRPFNSRSFRG